MWTNIKRIFRSGFIDFWRNGVVSIASLLVMTVTLLVVGSLVLASAFLNASLENVKNKVDISISFKVDAAEGDVVNIKNTLAALPEVKEVEYVSRDRELSDFRERHKDNALLVQSLDEIGNPFGARLNIKAKDPSQYESIAAFLGSDNPDSATFNKSLIDQVTFKKDIVDKLIKIIDSTEKIGFIVSLILVFMSILVTFNTISLAIYASREEISVMRLVGAANSYVRGPFLVEGVISGIISSFVAIVALYPLSIWVKGATEGVYGGINLVSYYAQNFGQIFLILLGSGITLGVISSFLAIRKYLRV